MKKIALILIVAVAVIAAAVLIGVFATSGDFGKNNNTTNPSVNTTIGKPVLTVEVTKKEHDVHADEKIQYVLPSNPTTGYSWNITASEGLDVVDEYRPPNTNMMGAPGIQVYTVSAKKAGQYDFDAVYKRPWENASASDVKFSQTIFVTEFEEDKPLTEPILVLRFDGNINPKVGDVVKVTTRGNPTTGYEWKAADGSLKILKSEYIADESKDGMVGVGGTYVWYVTAENAGEYLFSAEYKRANEVKPTNAFIFDIVFV